jgi:hypothetical protein
MILCGGTLVSAQHFHKLEMNALGQVAIVRLTIESEVSGWWVESALVSREKKSDRTCRDRMLRIKAGLLDLR